MTQSRYTEGFRAGQQWAAFETYAPNIVAAQARELADDLPDGGDKVYAELVHALRHAKRWSDV